MLSVSLAWRRMENIRFVNIESNVASRESCCEYLKERTLIYALIWFYYCSNKICVCMKRYVCLCLCLCVVEDLYMWHACKPLVCPWICLCKQFCGRRTALNTDTQAYVFLFVYSKNLQMSIQIYMSTEIVSLRYTKVLTYIWIHRGFVSLSSGSFLTCDLYTLCVGDL